MIAGCASAPPAAAMRAHSCLVAALARLESEIALEGLRTVDGERTNITYHSDICIPDRYRLGEVNDGWAVLNGPLTAEYGACGAGCGRPGRYRDDGQLRCQDGCSANRRSGWVGRVPLPRSPDGGHADAASPRFRCPGRTPAVHCSETPSPPCKLTAAAPRCFSSSPVVRMRWTKSATCCSVDLPDAERTARRFTGVSSPSPSVSALRSAADTDEPTPPCTPLSSTVITSLCDCANSPIDSGTGSTQRGSTTVTPMPWFRSSSATARARVANGPTATNSTSSDRPAAGAASTSTTPRRLIAGISSPTSPFGNWRSGRHGRRVPHRVPRAPSSPGNPHARHDAEHRQVPHSVVAGAAGAGDPGAVQHHRHGQLVQRHVDHSPRPASTWCSSAPVPPCARSCGRQPVGPVRRSRVY